jgi:hypothetical protein
MSEPLGTKAGGGPRVRCAEGGDEPRSGDQMRDPVFMLAPARSYSTISLAMLAGHPQLYGFPEMLLFTAPTVGELLNGAGRPGNAAWIRFGTMGVARAVAEVHEGSQSPAAVQRATDWLRARGEWQPVALMNHLLRLVYPKTGIEKSPNTVLSSGSLSACLQAYPHSRYVHLTRHPITTEQSMERHYAGIVNPEIPPQMLARRHLMGWYSCHLRIVKSLEALPADQWMRLRAEDLLREPRTWLPRMLDWLSLDHDNLTIERMMRTEQWAFAPRHDAVLGGADPLFMRNPVLRPVAAPPADYISPSWEINDHIRRRIVGLARYLGY